MIFFTISSNNYLAQCITLGKSLSATNPGHEFKIGLVDVKDPGIDYTSVPHEIIEVGKIGISDLEDLYLKYSITEFSTSVKPFYFRYFFETFPDNESFIYLDPDIQVFEKFTIIEDELKGNDIIIAPHFTTPLNDNLKQSEEDFLNSGLYNLGFIALRKSQVSNRMIDWWGERLRNKAYIDLQKGLFTDQIWINFVPLFFSGVKVLLHPGYNMAYWNLHERRLEGNNVETEDGKKWPLVFFHFSGYSPDRRNLLSKYQDRYSFENRPDIRALFDSYNENLLNNGYKFYNTIPCYYSIRRNEYLKRMSEERKMSVPFYKRVIRGILLQLASFFKITLN